MVEMNICYRFDPIYWQTACLSVNAKAYENSYENPNYGKLASAIGSLPAGLVVPPDVNRSKIGFFPQKNENVILSGLSVISGVGKNEIEFIVHNRPFKGVKDFLERSKGILTPKKIIVLIKSGMFREFEPDTRKLMIDYVSYIVTPKKKLTTANLKKLWDKLPDKWAEYGNLYELRSLIKKGVTPDSSVGQLFMSMLPKIHNFESTLKKQPEGDIWEVDNGLLSVDMKRFDKWYNKYMAPLKEWLKTDEATELEVNQRRRQMWIDECEGNIQSWSFEALNFYPYEHELDVSDLKDYYNYKGFSQLDSHPEPIRWSNYRGKKYPIYATSLIAGTVIDKDNVKSTISLLTNDGVAVVNLGRNTFAELNKKIMEGRGKSRRCISDTWLSRGNKLLISGYRRDNSFKLKKGQGMSTSVIKIEGYGDNLCLVYEK